MFDELPVTAAWRHQEARQGFESVFFSADGSGCSLAGHTVAVEEEHAWAVRYVITVDERWFTSAARIWGWSATGEHEVSLESDGSGRWQIDGEHRSELDGCLDVDLESSSCTNTIPVHRLELDVGQRAEAPAAYVRALDLDVQRLEQSYTRVIDDDEAHQRFDYRSPTFEFECILVYDRSGLPIEYPGIASRTL